jgi:hypothetical protein
MPNQKVLAYPKRGASFDRLIASLHDLHFRQEPFLAVLRHKEFGYSLTLKAHPHIPIEKSIEASWVKENHFPKSLYQFELDKIIIPGPAALVFVPARYFLDDDSLSSDIPERIDPFHDRQVVRVNCLKSNIEATLIQNSIAFDGQLIDFSPFGFRVDVSAQNPQNFYWLNQDCPITLFLRDARSQDILFCGEALISRTTQGEEHREMVLFPTAQQAARYKPKEARTKRFEMSPSPTLNFSHPLTGKMYCLKVVDIATLGFGVSESSDKACLLAGLLLPKIQVLIADSLLMTFSGQVVYREDKGDTIRCGIAILDMTVEDHSKLIGLVHQTEDEGAYVTPHHDPEEVMQFFFESGFIYSRKYAEIAKEKDQFLLSCRRLYSSSEGIARSFVYREKGMMTGHISALRIYRHAWLSHHHAALSNRRAGFKVLKQISDFINDSYYLNPVQLRYVAAIWRPDNSFPAKFFGRFAESQEDPQKCSMDTFAYFRSSVDQCQDWGPLSGPPWELVKAREADLYEFEGFYNKVSGGLLARAFDLTPDTFTDDSVSRAYRASDLKRERHLYALRHGVDMVAFIEVQDSDIGLNLSDLTNAVTIFVLRQEVFTPKILRMLQCIMAVKHNKENHPVLLYPRECAQNLRIEYEKDYTIWILNLEHSDAYMKHLGGYVKRRANGG